MAAGIAFLQTLPAGSHVLFHHDIYFGYLAAANAFFAAWGLDFDTVDMNDRTALERNLLAEHASSLGGNAD